MPAGSAKNPADAKFHFEFASDLAAVRPVQNAIVEAVEKHRFDEDSIFAIKLALEEALINAVRHGNKLDPSKHVVVDAVVTNKKLVVTIGDEGPGFDRSKVPDPTALENLERPTGRGLLLIETYMDDVKFLNKGRSIQMTRLNRAK